MIALLMASSCPSSKPVIGQSLLVKLPLTVIDTVGDHGHIPPGSYGRKYLPVPRLLVVFKDTVGDHGHIPPRPFSRKYLPVPRALVAFEDTVGDHGHIPPTIFLGKRVLKA